MAERKKEKGQFVCPTCGGRFISLSGLRGHEYHKHGAPRKHKRPKPRYELLSQRLLAVENAIGLLDNQVCLLQVSMGLLVAVLTGESLQEHQEQIATEIAMEQFQTALAEHQRERGGASQGLPELVLAYPG